MNEQTNERLPQSTLLVVSNRLSPQQHVRTIGRESELCLCGKMREFPHAMNILASKSKCSNYLNKILHLFCICVVSVFFFFFAVYVLERFSFECRK